MASVRPPSVRTEMLCRCSNSSSSASVVDTGTGRFHMTTVTMITTVATPSGPHLVDHLGDEEQHRGTRRQERPERGPETRMTSSGSARSVLVTRAARHVSGQRARPLEQPRCADRRSAGRFGPTAGGGCGRSVAPNSPSRAAAMPPTTERVAAPRVVTAAAPRKWLYTRLIANDDDAREEDEGADRRDEVVEIPTLAGVVGVHAARHAQQAEEVHRQEGDVEPDKHQPEVQLSEPFVEQLAGELGQPVIDGREERERRRRRSARSAGGRRRSMNRGPAGPAGPRQPSSR